MNLKLKTIFSIALIIYYDSRVTMAKEINFTTETKKYHLGITWTIENFLQLPYNESIFDIESPRFPVDENERAVHWYIKVTPLTEQNEKIKVTLKPDVLFFPKSVIFDALTSSECCLIDQDGTKNVCQTGRLKHVIKPGYPYGWTIENFISRKDLDSLSKKFLPNGHLTITCDIDGFLICNQTALRLYDKQLDRQWNCLSRPSNTVTARIYDPNASPDTYVVLKASGKEIKCHIKVLSRNSIFFGSMIRMGPLGKELDLSDEMNGYELEDFVSFLYSGTAKNLESTCPKLLKAAKKYHLRCLERICELLLSRENLCY